MNDTTGSAGNIRCGGLNDYAFISNPAPIYFTITPSTPMTTTTIRVFSTSGSREFDGVNAEKDALEYAQEQAHATNTTIYLQRVYKIVKPKREVTVEDVG